MWTNTVVGVTYLYQRRRDTRGKVSVLYTEKKGDKEHHFRVSDHVTRGPINCVVSSIFESETLVCGLELRIETVYDCSVYWRNSKSIEYTF